MPLAVVTVTIVLALAAAGCSGGPPAAPVRVATGTPVHYVALGGDDVFGGRRSLASSWPQLLFRNHLPVNATFVNLASPRHGGVEIRRDQLATALRLHPDVVTITLIDDLERATPPQTVQHNLSDIITNLRKIDGVRILVGTAPPDTGTVEARSAFDTAITTAARTGGAEIVDLSRVSASDAELRAQQISETFAQVLGKP